MDRRNTFIFIFTNDKNIVPTILRRYAVNWYHTYLLHLGAECKEDTIIQQYYWPNLRDGIRTHIKVCDTFQKNRKQNFKCEKLTAKEAEAIPRERLSVDIIGP